MSPVGESCEELSKIVSVTDVVIDLMSDNCYIKRWTRPIGVFVLYLEVEQKKNNYLRWYGMMNAIASYLKR